MKYSKYSVIIVGSGIAGMYLAYKLAVEKKHKDGILLITKSKINESNSRFAQGGIVAVMGENKLDSTSLHISDTIRSGCGLTDFNVAKFISENSSKVILDLLKIGVKFDKTGNNKLSFTLEAAHSIPRVLHAGGDATGKMIEGRLCELIQDSNCIDVYEHTLAVELLVDKFGASKGVLTYNTDTDAYEAIYSNAVVFATGGIGQVYKYTTNPAVTTGDGLALAIEAGAEIKDMEFIQFHPTALNVEGAEVEKMSLISEAVRGEGAIIVDENGVDFVKNFDERGSLAPRDVVSRAIYTHCQENPGAKIYLNIKKIGFEKFPKRFPTIAQICADNNIDITENLIPIAPSAHYCMGGVKAHVDGTTSIKGLYAIGEIACTGLHGANRLASNSLLECVVCAYELAIKLNKNKQIAPNVIDDNVKNIIDVYDKEIELEELDTACTLEQIKELMWNNVGILRNNEGLAEAAVELSSIEKKLNLNKKCLNREQYELRNILKVAKAIVQAALSRCETVGAHFRSDCINSSVEPGIKEIQTDDVFA